jgi:hypothetical protein
VNVPKCVRGPLRQHTADGSGTVICRAANAGWLCGNATNRQSAIDGRTTRHPGYAVSARVRKRIEEVFGWTKAAAGFRKTITVVLPRVGWMFTLSATAYNLVRLTKLVPAAA